MYMFVRLPLFRFGTAAVNSAKGSSQKVVPAADAFFGLSEFVSNYSQQRAEKGFGKQITFEKDIVPAVQKYKQLGFSKEDLNSLFASKITALCINNGVTETIKQDIVQLQAFLSSQYKLSNEQIRRLVILNHSLLSLTQEEINQRLQQLATLTGATPAQAIEILVAYPRILTSDMQTRIEKLKKVLSVWAGFKEDHFNSIIQRHPYLVDFNQTFVHDNIKIYLQKGFNTQAIFSLVSENPDALIEKPAHLQHCFHIPKKLGLSQKEVIDIFLKNPQLLTVCPVSMLPIKIKMLKNFKVVTDENLKNLWVNHTQLFLSSIGSLDLKNKYLHQRAFALGKPKNLPAYFALSYSDVIRPRCELVIRAKKENVSLDEDLQLSEEEFLTKYSISASEMKKIKEERPVTSETDQKIRFYNREQIATSE